jgi:hypothetical protein
VAEGVAEEGAVLLEVAAEGVAEVVEEEAVVVVDADQA